MKLLLLMMSVTVRLAAVAVRAGNVQERYDRLLDELARKVKVERNAGVLDSLLP